MLSKNAILVLALTAIMLFGVVCPCAAAEFRGFWVDAWGAGIGSQTDVNNLLGVVGTSTKGRIRDANCNAIVVQVRRNCDANYPSSMGEPYMSGLTPAGFNGLQAAINAAHDTSNGKQRIEVHAWIVTFRTSGGAVYTAHSSTPTGSLTTLDNYWPSRDTAGAEVADKAFDPGHPLAEEYTVNVAMDLVNNFDIDGIHYDYVRFTANNQGYNPTSVARYNQRYGLSGQPANVPGIHGAGDLGDQWDQWRRDQVSALVRKVYAKVQASKPWVKQSGSFVTWNPSPTASTREAFLRTRPYYDVYSDWDSWIQEGIVDAAIPMTYYDLGGSYPNDWTRWLNWDKDRHGTRHMYVGPGIYLNSLANAITELQQTRTASPAGNYADGFCGYSYRVPYVSGTWAGFSPTLLAQVTPTADTIPVMSWKASPTKGHISGTVTIASTGAWSDGIYGTTVSISGPDSRPAQLCDGTGFYSFIDLTPGAYTVTASRSGYADLVTPVTVAVGSVTGNMYVTDFALGSAPKPVITNVLASGITTTSATITWTTDLASSSQVQYGLTTGYGSSTTLNPSYVTSHSQSLSGLTPGTLYHYRVLSANANGTTTSSDYTFTTVGPPIISGVGASGITNAAATITWTTDQGATSQVQYGLTTGYGSSTTLNPSLVTSHSQSLSGLAANTLYHYRVISGSVNGTTTSGDYTFTTNGPPIISSVLATSIAANSATITWTTNTASDSRVNYGLTTSYGSQVSNTSAVTSHSISLTGLAASTTYHYQCVSVNAYGTATTIDYTFATTAVPVEIIVDDSAAVYSGSSSWTSATGSGYDSTYHYGNNRNTSITRICTWTPTITTAGYYNVYCTYPLTTNPTANATFTVNYNGGTTSASFNQANNVDVWQQIASNVPFAAGTTGNVVLNNMTGEANNTKRVVADAVKFVYVGSTLPPDDVIVDELDAGASSTGTWNPGTYGSGYNNGYKFADTAASVTATYTWTPTMPTSGLYDVYCWYTSGTNRTTAANYEIYYSGGNQTVPINQASGGGAWVLLSSGLPFNAGTAGYVRINNYTTGSVVIADAIRWVYVGSGGDTTPPTISIGAPSGTLTRSGPITYTISYADNVGVSAITLANGNVTLNKTGTANATTVNVTGSGLASRTVIISGITGNGTLGISIAAGTASDAASNLAPAAGPSATFTVDNTAPTVSIGAPSGTLTKSGPITYTITYGGANTVTLANGNVTLNPTGTANGTAVVSGSGTATRTVTVSSITGDGTLGISIAAGTATDTAGNSALAAGPSATFTVDNTAPTISIGAPSGTLTKSGPITYTITYGGASAVTLANGDVTPNKTGTANGTFNVTGSGTATRTVTVSAITGTGTLGITLAATTASDAAGNTAPAAGPSTTFAVDNTAPVINSVGVSPAMAAGGDALHAVVDATDNVAITSVTANGTALVLSGASTWAGDILALGPLGVHAVTIVANDAMGNSATNASATYKTARIVGTLSGAAWQPIMNSAGGIWLFKFWGRVAEIDDDNFTLNDGSTALPITVHAPGYKAKVVAGDYASARGILTIAGAERWIESAPGLITKY